MPCRRFTLLDAMILVGGSAVGFAGCRGGAEESYRQWFFEAQRFAGFFLMLGSCLLLILRCRGPRPSPGRLASQPGAVACCAVVSMQMTQVADSLISAAAVGEWGRVSRLGPAIWFFLGEFGHTSAAVVPICWTLLAMVGRWRPEPGWIDRSGRLLGWAWIAWGLAGPPVYWLSIHLEMTGPLRTIM